MRAMGGAKAIVSDRKSRVRVSSCLNGHAAAKGNHRPFPVYMVEGRYVLCSTWCGYLYNWSLWQIVDLFNYFSYKSLKCG